MSDLNTLVGIIEKIVVPMTKYLVPRIGRVVDIGDSENIGRVLAIVPSLGWNTKDTATWCFPSDGNSMIIPEIDDYILVEWIDGNQDLPIYRGIPSMIKDQIPPSYNGDQKLNILFEGTKDDIIKYKSGELTIKMSGDIMIGNNPSNGVARNGDTTQSTIVEDSTFWTWLTGAAAILAGLGLAVPTPTSLDSKINQGSSSVKVGD